jgi:2-iminobutanoate/2-iminopropanoate deaminase
MPKSIVRSDKVPTPVASYSSAVRADKFVFVSGQIPLDPVTGELVTGSIEVETRRVLDNLTLVLEAAHLNLSDVVKVTVYLTDMADFKAFDLAYKSYFPVDPPARATVAVAGLPRGVHIELEAVALAS